MAAYEVSARIVGVAPRRAQAVPDAPALPVAAADDATIDLVGKPLDVVVVERWEAFRERWSQATFYLFDPESWR